MTEGREHSWYEELAPAYALGVADEEERRAMEAHLRTCLPCQTRAAEYGELREALLYTVPTIEARAGLTEDLRLRLQNENAAPSRTRWWASLVRPGVAFGLAAIALLLLTNVYWAGRTAQAERQIATLVELTQGPGIVLDPSAEASHASGILYAQPSANVALLCVYDLPELEAGKTYQAWLVRGDTRVSGGTFQVDHDGYGVLLVQSDIPIGEFDGLGITVEPAGGSPTPTMPRVMGGSL